MRSVALSHQFQFLASWLEPAEMSDVLISGGLTGGEGKVAGTRRRWSGHHPNREIEPSEGMRSGRLGPPWPTWCKRPVPPTEPWARRSRVPILHAV